MHSKNNNTEVMAYDNLGKVIEGLSDFLLAWNQMGLETKLRRSNFILDCVNLLYYKFKRGGSYNDYPDRITKKKATISIKNDHDTCSQYAATLALNFD